MPFLNIAYHYITVSMSCRQLLYIHTSLQSTVSIYKYTVYQTLVTTQGTGDMGLVCKLGQQRRSDVTVTEREETEMVGNTK